MHPLSMDNCFLIHQFSPNDKSYTYCTKSELRSLYRSFGQPFVRTLNSLLVMSSESTIDKKTIDALDKMKYVCKIFKRTTAASRRFNLTVGTAEIRSNHQVQVDTMFIHGHPILHVINEVARFCAVSFLRSQATKNSWNKLQRMWSLVYLGPQTISWLIKKKQIPLRK